MNKSGLLDVLQSFDERRDIVIPGDKKATLSFCIRNFIDHANASILDHGYFAVALSGGSTPAAIYKGLAEPANRDKVDWSKALLFWSDERSVPPTDPNSNYHMAMESGLGVLGIAPEQVFRMQAEEDIVANAEAYERLIQERLPGGVFDLIMLGMGDDGHTASLFPHTHALRARNRLVVANWVSQHHTWRMSFTFECINNAKAINLYVIGANKAEMVAKVLTSPLTADSLPSQRIGTSTHKALWILDHAAAAHLL